MEKFRFEKVTNEEIFDALTDEESSPDWDEYVLSKAGKKDVEKVNDILGKGLTLNEARLELKYLKR